MTLSRRISENRWRSDCRGGCRRGKHSREFPEKIDPQAEIKWRKEHPGESLFKNGSFETLDGWFDYSHRGSVSVDTNVYFSAPSSVRINSKDRSLPVEGKDTFCRASAVQGVKLKPGRRYRLSGFIKLDGVEPINRIGGTDFLVEALNKAYPADKSPYGTRDCHRFAYEFETPKTLDETRAAVIGPRLIYASGTVWIDDIRLDELAESVREDAK